MDTSSGGTRKEFQADPRRWLAHRLGKTSVPNPLWDELVEDHYVSDAEESSKGKDDLIKRARRLLRFHEKMGEGSRENSGRDDRSSSKDSLNSLDVAMPLDDRVQARAEAVAVYALKHHARNWNVTNLRRKMNAPLPLQQARDLLHARKHPPHGLEDIRQFWDGEGLINVWVGEASEVGTLLWKLADLAKILHGPWLPAHAAWWILTDVSPPVAAFSFVADGQTGPWPTFTLTVPAWAPTDVVGRYHGHLKRVPKVRELFERGPTPSDRRVAVFRFVAEFCEFSGARSLSRNFKPRQEISWRELVRRWNEQLPEKSEWRYTDYRHFYRDFFETRDGLLRTHWD